MDRKKLGQHGENKVQDYLIAQNYVILQHNYHQREGEIDLIAVDPETQELVFVEVKTRRTRTFGYPEEAVTPHKLQKMEKAALKWLDAHQKTDHLWRADILSVELGKDFKITHLKNVSL